MIANSFGSSYKVWNSGNLIDKRSFSEVVKEGRNKKEGADKGINNQSKSEDRRNKHSIEEERNKEITGSWPMDEKSKMRLRKCLIGKVTSLDNIKPIQNLYRLENNGECNLKYTGGRNVMLIFDQEESANMESVFDDSRSGEGAVEPQVQQIGKERIGDNVIGVKEIGESPEKGSAGIESMAPVLREEDKES
ncbi:hypothetical protein L6452_17769 [Arctium lappa]|uniref:Uncharacterized protein n=1 Tax=Arctium lappa TaxID=4217 RepID=A0ACB9C4I9_ARCLA|nr:hypothetical protein L6452_17769 [Arctium lappa]